MSLDAPCGLWVRGRCYVAPRVNAPEEAEPSPAIRQRRLGKAPRSQSRQLGMEPYGVPWLQPVAIGLQIDLARKRPKEAKTVAVSCNRLPRGVHGKQGVCRRLPPPSCEGGGRSP